MPVAVLLPLDTWQNFYVIVGTAAATLTGLMFVVITLIAQIQISSPSPSFSRARSHVTVFTTSNVFHFGAVLLARWDSERTLAGALACWPAAWSRGSSRGDLHAHRPLAGTPPSGHQPVLSDWLWYTVLPLVSYAALVVAAIVLPTQPVPALFVIAAVTMLLLFIGIHNAWDVVTYTAFERSQPQDNKLGK